MGYTVVHIGEIEPAAIVGGCGSYRLHGERVPFTAGTVVGFEPETRSGIAAGDEGCTMVAVGVRRGSHEPRGHF
jgi:hypothetical protein